MAREVGAEAAHADMLRFDRNDQVTEHEPTIKTYLDEAMGYAAEGRKPPKHKSEPDLPVELIEALRAEPELAQAFQSLTPGRRKSYVINLRGAKKSETRFSRIAKFRPKILLGKGQRIAENTWVI